MQKLKQIYRSNYAGENIVTQLNLVGGEWNPETEFVPNGVVNTFTTTQAVAIGNGESRLSFDLNYIASHQGGLLGTNRLQSYGCNALYRDFTPDFLVATGKDIVDEIANSGYTENNIVYSTADVVLEYPEKFYLIPQNLQFDAGAVAAYMACFDGHKKVFLMGYDHYDTHSAINNVYKDTNGYPLSTQQDNGEFYAVSLRDVISTYSDVEFVRVMPTNTHWVHHRLTPLVNFRQIDYRDFVVEADIGLLSVAA
jgi:hypothetical protein